MNFRSAPAPESLHIPLLVEEVLNLQLGGGYQTLLISFSDCDKKIESNVVTPQTEIISLPS